MTDSKELTAPPSQKGGSSTTNPQVVQQDTQSTSHDVKDTKDTNASHKPLSAMETPTCEAAGISVSVDTPVNADVQVGTIQGSRIETETAKKSESSQPTATIRKAAVTTTGVGLKSDGATVSSIPNSKIAANKSTPAVVSGVSVGAAPVTVPTLVTAGAGKVISTATITNRTAHATAINPVNQTKAKEMVTPATIVNQTIAPVIIQVPKPAPAGTTIQPAPGMIQKQPSQIPTTAPVPATASPITPAETTFAITSQIDHLPQNILTLLQTYGPLTTSEISYNIRSTNLSIPSILKIMNTLNAIHYQDGLYYFHTGEVRSDTIAPNEVMDLIKDTSDEIRESMERIELLKKELNKDVKLQNRGKSAREFLKDLVGKYGGERGIRGDAVYATALKTLNVDLGMKRKIAAGKSPTASSDSAKKRRRTRRKKEAEKAVGGKISSEAKSPVPMKIQAEVKVKEQAKVQVEPATKALVVSISAPTVAAPPTAAATVAVTATATVSKAPVQTASITVPIASAKTATIVASTTAPAYVSTDGDVVMSTVTN